MKYDQWSKGINFSIPKNGWLKDCNNWKGITLLSVPKIIANNTIQRLLV